MRKFYLVCLVLLAIMGLFGGYRAYQHSLRLPSEQNPIYFYSPQTDDHLQKTLLEALSKAKESIWIRIYGMTDAKFIKLINAKADAGLNVQITYDSTASKSLKKRLSKQIKSYPYTGKGIGHQKLCIIDHTTVWCGSTNFTSKSLLMHDNLLIGLYDKTLAKHIIEQEYGQYRPFHSKDYSFYMLPADCIDEIIKKIDKAKRSLKIAMFTWTNQKLLEATLRAKARGVHLMVVCDQSTISGSGKKISKGLKEAKVPLHTQKSLALMHHKFLLIDDEILITGSANWTKAAFEKNDEHVFIYSLKNKEELLYFKTFWNHLWNDTFSL